MKLPHLPAALLVGLVALLVASTSQARSVLELPYPSERTGHFPAVTYADDGRRLGDSAFDIEDLADGRVRISATTHIDGGASNRSQILLAPVPGRKHLRILAQRSESRDETGRSMGVMSIDHESGIATCAPGEAPGAIHDTTRIALPARERVANLALNLLFQPLAQEEVREVDFEILVCRALGSGPRILPFSAKRDETRVGRPDAPVGDLVEIRYQPDFGPFVGWMAGHWMPRLSLWLDPHGSFIGQRVPLYSKGPEVIVLRKGHSPDELRAD